MDGMLVDPELWNGVVVPTGEKDHNISLHAKCDKTHFVLENVHIYIFYIHVFIGVKEHLQKGTTMSEYMQD